MMLEVRRGDYHACHLTVTSSTQFSYPHVRACHQTADDAGSAKGRPSRLSSDMRRGDHHACHLTVTSSTQFSYPHVRACHQMADDAGSAKGRPSRLSSDGDLLNAKVGHQALCLSSDGKLVKTGPAKETPVHHISQFEGSVDEEITGEMENIVQDVFDFTATSAPEKNHMTEISLMARHEKSDMDNPPKFSLLNPRSMGCER
ncbi:12105_t:CDS:2 [Funneliformis geosporum]|nr:12105_t:CDS:2 [Funneliformis geosporum]